jgi:hypothetical protein
MPTFRISKPSPGGTGWQKADHLDHLHVFLGDLTEREVETSYGDAVAAHVDHVMCVQCLEEWDDQLVFGAALVPRLTGDLDAEVIVGRLGQGLAKPGRSAPWTLDDPTDADLEAAEAFVEKYVHRLPSGAVVIDHQALAADRSGPEPF